MLNHSESADIFPIARQLTAIGLFGLAIAGLYIYALVNSFGA